MLRFSDKASNTDYVPENLSEKEVFQGRTENGNIPLCAIALYVKSMSC